MTDMELAELVYEKCRNNKVAKWEVIPWGRVSEDNRKIFQMFVRITRENVEAEITE